MPSGFGLVVESREALPVGDCAQHLGDVWRFLAALRLLWDDVHATLNCCNINLINTGAVMRL